MDDDGPDLFDYESNDDNSKEDRSVPYHELFPWPSPKKPVPGLGAPYTLLIYNLGADNFDPIPDNLDNFFPPGPLRARLWIDPGDEHIRWTRTDEYDFLICWTEKTEIKFFHKIEGFLYVEIVRYEKEPCTSKGESTVGIARFPIPVEVDVEETCFCKMKRIDDGGECWVDAGDVTVDMKWEWDFGAAELYDLF